MKMLCLLTLLLVSTNAFAIVDPDPNTAGFFFDLDANDPCLEVPPFTVVTGYMILTNPTFSAVTRLYVGYHTEGSGMISSILFPDGTPFLQPVGDVTLTYLYPIPTTPATVLATFELLNISYYNEPLFIFLHGNYDTLTPRQPDVFTEDSVQLTLTLSAGIIGPTAQLNGDCEVVGVSTGSFDWVKAMYR